jgi:hypothetical protein
MEIGKNQKILEKIMNREKKLIFRIIFSFQFLISGEV